jgi:DNA-binding transcriptional ArsR family regulator
MSVKLRLVEDEQVLLEVSLSPDEWSKEDLMHELTESRRENYHRDIWGVLANERRTHMMMHLMNDTDHTASFKEFQDELGMNPKSIREHAMVLRRCGLLSYPRRGSYRLQHRAGLRFMVLNVALRRVLRYMMESYSEKAEVIKNV